MLTLVDAQNAVDLVRSVYGGQYASGLDANGVDEVFVICDEPTFTSAFTHTYNCCFKQANGFSESASDFIGGVNAFVASDYRNFKRKIYVKNYIDLKWGTLVHEYIHYLTNRYLYPTCYERGGAWPDLIEGITEYLTRTTSDEVKKIRTSYERLYRQVQSYADTNKGARQAIVDCCFKGQTEKLGGLFPRI